MRSLLYTILLLVSTLVVPPVWAQQMLAPEVLLSYEQGKDMRLLEEEVTHFLESYQPQVDTPYYPTRPIRCVVQLHLYNGDGFRYQCDLYVLMSRPIYGTEVESPILIAHEKALEIEYQGGSNYLHLGQEMPEAPLLQLLYYYTTLGTMYYYDSMSALGGTPFMKHLLEHQSTFESAWMHTHSTAGMSHHTYLSPKRHLTELRGSWGDKMREVWYLYHREGLDQETSATYRETLKEILESLKSIQRQDATLGLLSHFSDTKGKEIASKISTLQHPELCQLIRDVLPSIQLD